MNQPYICGIAVFGRKTEDWNLQFTAAVLGQLFLFTCMVAAASVAGILFVVFGPVPVKRKVTIVPRLSIPAPVAAPPSLVSQLAPARNTFFTPPAPLPPSMQPPPEVATAHAAPPPVEVKKPKGGKVQPLPRNRSAKGTRAPSPMAPVVRSRPPVRDEDVATSPVQLFDIEEFTAVDDPVTVPRGRSMRHR